MEFLIKNKYLIHLEVLLRMPILLTRSYITGNLVIT